MIDIYVALEHSEANWPDGEPRAAFTDAATGVAWVQASGKVDGCFAVADDCGGFVWRAPSPEFADPGDWDATWSLARVPLDPA